jgi:phosphatidylglycerophosphatase A
VHGTSPPTGSPLARALARSRAKGTRPAGRPGPLTLLAAWGPCGYAPVAPGTFGTLGAIPLWWALSTLPPLGYAAALAAFCALSVVAARAAGRYWGVADASPIVIDEVAGYLVTVALFPFSWPVAILGFVLFRIFDVLKPWPASALDRVKNGAGVVADDLAAGAYAWLVLQAIALALRATAGCEAAAWWCAGSVR